MEVDHLPSTSYPGKVDAIIGRIRRAVQEVTGVEVRAFGSSANGFGDESSDVDVVLAAAKRDLLELLGTSHRSDRELAPMVLRNLEGKLKAEGFAVMQRIMGARVPILKMSLQYQGRKLECDLSVNNLLPVFNTKLLKSYAEINPHVVSLVQECKAWAKEHEVHGAAYGHLSSYSFTLMVIFFMQVRGDLPVLQANAHVKPVWFSAGGRRFNVAMEEGIEGFEHKTAATFLDFIRFYRDKFEWGEWVVSVRKGECLDMDAYPELKQRLRRGVTQNESLYMIHIEDPFDTTRNLNCVLAPRKNQHLWQAFLDTPTAPRRWRSRR